MTTPAVPLTGGVLEVNLVDVLELLETNEVTSRDSMIEALLESEKKLQLSIDSLFLTSSSEADGSPSEQARAELLTKVLERVRSRRHEILREKAVDDQDPRLVSKASGYVPLPFDTRVGKSMTHVPSSKLPQQKSIVSGAPEIDPKEIAYSPASDFIGEGSYGMVYKGTCRGQQVAIKVPKKKLTPKQIELFKKEIAYMSKIYHPNVVLFLGAQTKQRIMIVTELCVTDCEHLLRKGIEKISLYERMKMAQGAALGMNWLHGICNIVHRDLKPANLLLANDGTVKVTDFGFSDFFSVGSTFVERGKGTPLWMSPEVIMGQETNEKRDVYSFGVILWELLTGKVPYAELRNWKEFKKAVCQLHKRPRIPTTAVPSLEYLIARCWDPDYRNRPSFSEIVFRLKEVIVDTVIRDADAARFWKVHFLRSAARSELVESTPISQFLSLILKTLAVDSSSSVAKKYSKALTKFLVDRNPEKESDEPVVTMFSFDRAVTWFGPFFHLENGKHVLNAMKEFAAAPYSCTLTQSEAVARLQRRMDGTFLVRLSSTTPGKPLTLSVVTDKTTIDHRRISHHRPGFSDRSFSTKISNVVYEEPTLDLLIQRIKPILKLSVPCPRPQHVDEEYL
eukprot:TRINITY_DN10376_c0_g1_i1.p1 TRINITY_DN10376_c0_g1~~TRINITY_DN10376_c0_g1_i1.p1  ORF type:complete len:622 (-),score=104.24 TRINITY_DN10376_c0_g1_i1:565-2430(-)